MGCRATAGILELRDASTNSALDAGRNVDAASLSYQVSLSAHFIVCAQLIPIWQKPCTREPRSTPSIAAPPPPPCTPLFEINLRRLPCLFPPLRHGLHCHSHAKLVALLCLELALFRAMLDADLESGGDLLDSERGGCYAGQREERERCC